MTEQTFTNTGLATARRCLTEFELRYNLKLDADGADSDALQVGSAWHHAFDVMHKGGNQYAALHERSPSPLWAEKLCRLFAAYDWYWKKQEFKVIEAEHTFRFSQGGGITYEGQLDGIIEIDGRRGILERKTTASSLDEEGDYWDRLRLDVQVGLYASSVDFTPSFILYDVVRKPTINPKKLSKADCARLEKESKADDQAGYYGQVFTRKQLYAPLDEGRESITMYGARLTADIGDRPEYYFARREVVRGKQDFERLFENLDAQVDLINYAQDHDLMHRNPDACATFGRCQFFGLCSNNVRPRAGDPAPDGFHFREHLHPELASHEPQA